MRNDPLTKISRPHCRNGERPATILLLCAALGFALLNLWQVGDKSLGIDLYQFWAVGQALHSAKVENVYSEAGRGRMGVEIGRRAELDPGAKRHRLVVEYRPTLDTYSTPFLYSLFALFGPSDYETAHQMHSLLSLACALFAVWVLCGLVGLSVTTTLLVIVFLVGWFAPLRSDMRVGNVNEIQLAALALLCWVRIGSNRPHRHLLGGILLGATLMLKPNTIYVALLWVWALILKRQYGALRLVLVGVGIGAASAFSVSILVFGSIRCWGDWSAAVGEMPDGVMPLGAGNVSLVMLLKGRIAADVGPILPFVFLLPVLGAMWRTRDRARGVSREGSSGDPLDSLWLVGMGCLVYCLSAKLVWIHYLVLTIPSFLYALRPRVVNPDVRVARPSARQWLAVLAAVLMSAGTQLELGNAYMTLAAMSAGSLLLYGVGLSDLLSEPGAEDGPDLARAHGFH